MRQNMQMRRDAGKIWKCVDIHLHTYIYAYVAYDTKIESIMTGMLDAPQIRHNEKLGCKSSYGNRIKFCSNIWCGVIPQTNSIICWKNLSMLNNNIAKLRFPNNYLALKSILLMFEIFGSSFHETCFSEILQTLIQIRSV